MNLKKNIGKHQRIEKWHSEEFTWARSCRSIRSKRIALEAKLTAFAVHLKRIAGILSSEKETNLDFLVIF